MELSKIKVGKHYNYRARVKKGRGKVTDIETAANGTWITLYDKTNDVVLRLRASQITG